MMEQKFMGKKWQRVCLCFSLGMILAFGVVEGTAFGNPYFDGSVPSYSWRKNLLDNSEYAQGYPPNILFLIDSSGSMLQDKDNTWTYGDGSRPWKRSQNEEEYYWGDDTINSNNFMSSSNYHPRLQQKADGTLMPNDSRLYILRNVMYQLLGRAALMTGINIAIATYNQKEYPDGIYTGDGQHWYWYGNFNRSAYREGTPWERPRNEAQYISWKGRGKGMKLRSPLLPAVDSSGKVLQSLIDLFDGTETSINPEIRADGGTPLAVSINDDDDDDEKEATSAYDFFRNMNGDFDGYCQANWLIVMTDGADDNFWYNRRNIKEHATHTSEAVHSLYYKTRNFLDKDKERMEYPVRTMVIGFIDPQSTPKNMALADELDRAADYGDDGLLNDSAHAYYADNFDNLFAAFEEILVTIKEMSGSGSAPSVRPGIPGSEGFVYVPGRQYKENSLWTGTLKKYDIDFLGEPGDEVVWEAASEITPSSRKILTANWHAGGSRHPGTNLATFTSANWEAVVRELGIRYALSDNTLIDDDEDVIEEQAKCFIRWYRGEDPSTAGDPCPNWGTRESPLADMERSGLVVVGPPQALWGDDKYIEFRDDHKERDESVYIQSSEGMLHCFDAGNGEEHWAFIPPQALRWARIAGLRAERQTDEGEPSFWRWSWYGGDPEKSERAVPREILGGPLVVEDVLIGTGDNERYATVLLGCLGYGGYGLYALEITDPEKPRFLWAVEMDASTEAEEEQRNPFLPEDTQKYPLHALLHWVEDGTDNVLPTAAFRYCPTVNGVFSEDTRLYRTSEDALPCPDTYLTGRHLDKYGDLAFTLGAPFMGRLRLESGKTPRSVGFIGGGLRERLEEESETRGCVLYVFGLEDGRIYGAWGKGITTEYYASDPYFGEEISSEDLPKEMPMGMIYAPISPMVLPGGDMVRRIYAPDSNGYIHCIKFYDDAAGEELPMENWEHEIPVYLADSSPVAIPYQMPVGTIGNAIWLFGGTKDILTPSGNLTNDNQYIFGIKVSAFCDGAGCGLDCTDEPIAMENLKTLDAEDGDEVLVIDSSACGYEDGAEKYWGWKIDLLEEEYVSAPPTLSDIFGRLFVATFVPDDTVDRCVAESGTGKLFVFDAQNGASDWPEGTEEKYVAFNNIRIGGIAVYDSFRTEGGEEEPGTRVILTFEKGKGGAANLEDALETAGAKDVAVGDEVASFFLGLTESRKSALGVIHFNETSLRFWKNSE